MHFVLPDEQRTVNVVFMIPWIVFSSTVLVVILFAAAKYCGLELQVKVVPESAPKKLFNATYWIAIQNIFYLTWKESAALTILTITFSVVRIFFAKRELSYVRS